MDIHIDTSTEEVYEETTRDEQLLIAESNEDADVVDKFPVAIPEENTGSDSGIDPDPDNIDLKLSDKASFRAKSTSFLKVLEDSAKYRRLPEPTGKKPGRLQELQTPREVPEMEDEEALVSPRRSHDSLRPLARAKAGQIQQVHKFSTNRV